MLLFTETSEKQRASTNKLWREFPTQPVRSGDQYTGLDSRASESLSSGREKPF